ncbi:MAG: hypothetical protein A4E26_00061 [Methanobacterium sp. PtaU1.Bin097]|uniref:Uncharacterized protein n=1 Tax=candidate division WWE3 bacterium TaxID=2053526 RepID=A0A7X9E6L4_UNCKA|nr:hypothetical protein [candidate division WWE3 bacterium]OPY24983.1 MAG: hypothetical protein A4E26_00061 [Methanobacterium sp. PtaU1.Bin097]
MAREEIKGTGVDGNYWKPNQEGQEIEGKIIEFISGDYGEQMTIKTPDGNMIDLPAHSDLQDKQRFLKEGDYIYVTLEKLIPNSNPKYNDKKVYKVEREVEEQEKLDD